MPPTTIVRARKDMWPFIGATSQREVQKHVNEVCCDDKGLKRHSHFNTTETDFNRTCRASLQLLRLLFSWDAWDGSALGTGFKQIFHTYYGKKDFKVLEGQPRLVKDTMCVAS